MNLFYFFSAAATLGIFSLGVLFAGGDYYFFFDPASMLLVLFPAVFMSLANFSATEIGISFSAAGKRSTASREELMNAVIFFDNLKEYFKISGFIAFFMGIILMLSGLISIKDPDLFGTGLAAALVAVIYAAFFIMVFVLPFKTAVSRKLNSMT